MPAPLPRIAADTFIQPDNGPSVAANLAGIAAPFAALGQIGDELHEAGVRAALPDAQARGAASVGRDENGDLTLVPRLELNAIDRAYNQGATASYVSEATLDRRQTFQKLREQNADDPQAFSKAADSWLKATAFKAPMLVRGDLLNAGRQEIAQHVESLSLAKFTRDGTQHAADVEANIKDLVNHDLLPLAKNGGVNSDKFVEIAGQITNLQSSLKGSPFGKTEDQLRLDYDGYLRQAPAESALGQAVRVYQAQGRDAGLKAGDELFGSDELKLSPEEQDKYQNDLWREITRGEAVKHADQAQAVAALKGKIEDAHAAALDGIDPFKIVSQDQLRATLGDQADSTIHELNFAADTGTAIKFVSQAPPAAVAAELTRLDPKRLFEGGSSTNLSKGVLPNGMLPGHGGNLDRSKAGDNWTTAQVTEDGIEKHYVLPTLPGDKPPSGDGIELGDAVNRFLKTKQHYGAFDTDETAAKFMQAGQKGGVKSYGYADDARRFEAVRQTAERRFDAMAKAAEQRDKALADDPANFVMSTRPDIRQTMQTASQNQDAASFQKAVSASIDTQRQLGVAAPRVLSKPQVATIVQSFSNAPDKTQLGQHMTGVIAGLEQTYGNYFPDVMSELEAKGMPAEAIGLATVKGDPIVSDRLARAIDAGRKNLKELVDKPADIDHALAETMSVFDRTLIGQTGAAKVSADMRAAAQIYAYQLTQEGADADTAASRAANDIITGRYSFEDTYRVPKGIDAGAVSNATRTIQQSIDPNSISPLGSQIDPKMPEATRRDMTAKMLRQHGTWATLPDDSGLALLWPQQTGWAPVLDKRGMPIRFTWDQLLKTPEAAPDLMTPALGMQ